MFKVSARTVIELGSELISSDVIALYELIKNAFDAGSKRGVEIKFAVIFTRDSYLSAKSRLSSKNSEFSELNEFCLRHLVLDAPPDLLKQARDLLAEAVDLDSLGTMIEKIYSLNSICVSDEGCGMSLSDLEKTFLVIGTPSRKREVEKALSSGQDDVPYLGEKGIGRLSAMRLGDRLRVESARIEDKYLSLLEIDWVDFQDIEAFVEDIKISPKAGGEKNDPKWHGTRIIIKGLKEDWNRARVEREAQYDFARLTDPFLDPLARPRIALFWNGDRISIPWMEPELLEHANAKLKVSFTVDSGVPSVSGVMEARHLGYDHPHEVEKISLDEAALCSLLENRADKIHPDFLISTGPFRMELFWYNRRIVKAIDGIGDQAAVREKLKNWGGILLFRDGFRVFPYGEEDDDWLSLDRKALGSKGYLLNKTQFVGRVCISRTGNPNLIDQTNREGLRETAEQKILLKIIDGIIDTELKGFFRRIDTKYKNQKLQFGKAKSEVSNLVSRSKKAMAQLKKVSGSKGQEQLEQLQQTIFEFSDFADRAKKRISEVEKENRQMVEMAGIGLMVEVVAHELARASEAALDNLKSINRHELTGKDRTHLDSLSSQMKSLSKRIRILDPLSVSGRQRKEKFEIGSVISEITSAHENQFLRHGIECEVLGVTHGVEVKNVKGMFIQIIENLISNSKYWTCLKKNRDPSYKPKLTIQISAEPVEIRFSDNGCGVSEGYTERIFEMFFSLKEKSGRRGLGLYIARECARTMEGDLVMSKEINPETGKYHEFIFTLSS